MSTRRKVWVISFLTLTGITVGMELYAAFSGDKNAVPWTDLLTNLPWWIVIPAALILAAWLPGHFIDAYRRKAAGIDPPKPGEK